MHISTGFRTEMVKYFNYAVSIFQSAQLCCLYNYIIAYFVICYDFLTLVGTTAQHTLKQLKFCFNSLRKHVRELRIFNTITKTKTKLRGLSPHANYTDRAAAVGRRS